VGRGAGFSLVNSFRVRHESRDGPAVPGDNDFLASFYAVEQGAEGIFGFEGADFLHYFLSLTQSSLI
jgi:hypothetical protein